MLFRIRIIRCWNSSRTASGIVIEKGGFDAHAVTVGLSLDIPVLIDVKNATDILKSGVFVNMDCENGVIVAGE